MLVEICYNEFWLLSSKEYFYSFPILAYSYDNVENKTPNQYYFWYWKEFSSWEETIEKHYFWSFVENSSCNFYSSRMETNSCCKTIGQPTSQKFLNFIKFCLESLESCLHVQDHILPGYSREGTHLCAEHEP